MARIPEVGTAPLEHPVADLLVLGVFADEPPPSAGLPAPLVVAARELSVGFSAREGRRRSAPLDGGEVGRLELRGLGRREQLHPRRLRKWLQQVVAEARAEDVATLAVRLPPHPLSEGPEASGRLARELALSCYRFEEFKERDDEPEEEAPSELRLLVPGGEEEAHHLEAMAAAKVIRAVVVARDLANTPPNVATPEWMAERAAAMAAEQGISAEILAREDLERRGLGGLLAVGGGSANPPRLVRLEWRGAEAPRIALVGKGVTFDTGGISIKPSSDMDEMKYDKAGACAVLGVFHAAAELALPVHLVAWVPFAENMPDGASYRPGDIVRCYNGKTVEVLNTDAEGRMILADALALAAEETPDHLIELSTLTGACVVALGQHAAGLYTPDDTLADELLAAGGRSGDRLWRMPLWPELRETMKGHHGDLKNVGGRWGGANNAAAFLSFFVGETSSWAHLDVAGPAYVGSDGEGSKGATGFGVALLVEWLRRRTGTE